MPFLKSSLFVLAAAAALFVGDTTAQAQNRGTTHRRSTTGGMNSGGLGTSPTQSAIQSAQGQARSIANRQHQIWLAHRLKKNAEEKAAAEAKAAAKAAGTDTKSDTKTETSTPASTSTKTAK